MNTVAGQMPIRRLDCYFLHILAPVLPEVAVGQHQRNLILVLAPGGHCLKLGVNFSHTLHIQMNTIIVVEAALGD